MTTWTHPPQLALLEQSLAVACADPKAISDQDLITQVRATYWGTNCWSWVEMSLAIISAVCALRPQLAEELIGDPIDVMIQGGLDNEDDVIAQGVAFIRARSVALKRSSNVVGDVVHKRLSMEMGAVFEGQCRFQQDR